MNKKEGERVTTEGREDLMHEMEIIAKDTGISVQEAIDRALEQFLKNNSPKIN